jgi:hypothetical protein
MSGIEIFRQLQVLFPISELLTIRESMATNEFVGTYETGPLWG